MIHLFSETSGLARGQFTFLFNGYRRLFAKVKRPQRVDNDATTLVLKMSGVMQPPPSQAFITYREVI
jgi:hypothetical protein